MSELWDVITGTGSPEQFWEWFKIQSWGMQLFLGAVSFGICYIILMLVFALIPWED